MALKLEKPSLLASIKGCGKQCPRLFIRVYPNMFLSAVKAKRAFKSWRRRKSSLKTRLFGSRLHLASRKDNLRTNCANETVISSD